MKCNESTDVAIPLPWFASMIGTHVMLVFCKLSVYSYTVGPIFKMCIRQ